MKIKISLITYFAIPLSVFSQKTTTVFDTINVVYEKCYEDIILDSIVYIKDDNFYTDTWTVYFDQEEKTLAYFSFFKNDTCTILNYWRNGNIKKKCIYIKDDTDFFIWHYEELYCLNNQLIRKAFPNKIEKQLITNYYCNGKKMNEFELEFGEISGNYRSWYDTGTKKEILNYIDNVPEGEWFYYKEDETLEKVETYKKGKLIKSIK